MSEENGNVAEVRYGAYSADVRMHLNINGRKIAIRQLGPEFIILDHPDDHLPAEAEISLSIDGDERRWRVFLVDGISASQRRTRIARCPDAEEPPVG